MRNTLRLPLLAASALLATSVTSLAQTVVRVHDGATIAGPSAPAGAGGGASSSSVSATVCGASAIATYGQPVPGGGTLSPGAFFNPATVNHAGRIAFISGVDGSARNQGVFVADASGLTPIAMGCGGGGGSGVPGSGCGDPSPVGGTFSGFFTGSNFAPSLNDAGDVLFFSDVNGGTSPRGLFLFRAATSSIVKVAAVGDPSPLGGTFDGIGPGTLSASGVVVFLARPIGTTNSNAFRWTNGVVTKVAAVGDAAPGGGTFSLIGTESFGFSDGTQVPAGPVPGINDAGDVTFRAIVSGGPVSRGIVLQQSGVNSWLVKAGDPVPGGGVYLDMQAASINNAGQIAFFADFNLHMVVTSGWIVGKPGAWRKALAFFDPVDNGICFGLAFSRNPMTPLDDFGNLILWTDVQLPNLTMQEHLVVSTPTGALVTVAKKGDATPLGGTYNTFQSWPSMNDMGRGTVSAGTPGASGGVLNAHILSAFCAPTVASVAPPFGARAGGTPIAIAGLGFAGAGAPAVTIGGASATGVSVVNDALIQATTPAGAMGAADVVVTNATGTGTLAGGYVFTPAVIVSPSSVAIGGPVAVQNFGFPPSSFATWASNVTTTFDFPPFGTFGIGPSPLFDLVSGSYPAGAPHTANFVMPNNPALHGLTLYVQSFSLDSAVPLAGTFTNVSAFTVQ